MATASITHPEPADAGLANPRVYWKISGILLSAVALLGLGLNTIGAGTLLGEGFLAFDWTHNLVHALLAGTALYLGFSAIDFAVAKGMAKVIGVVYLGLGVVGFLSPTVFGIGSLLGLHLEIGENLIHIILGSWGAYAGFTQ